MSSFSPSLKAGDAGVLPPPKPPAPAAGWQNQLLSLGRYLMQSEVHTYAFSVAANAILSFFPLIVMMYTLARRVFHWPAMEASIGEMMRFFLPTVSERDSSFVIRNMARIVSTQHGIQLVSLVMLFISCTGVFLPLEVALNQVWGVVKSRSYLMNQVVSLGLALTMAFLAMGVVMLNAGQRAVLTFVFFGHTDNFVFNFLIRSLIEIAFAGSSIAMFFLIYWLLPNRKIPPRAALPAAIVIGLMWQAAKAIYFVLLPKLDLEASYGPFYISVGLLIWGYVTGLLMLAGAHYSATRHTLYLARKAERERTGIEAEPESAGS
jgi:YihY family inner membrane protein